MGLAVRKTRNSMLNSTVLYLQRTVIGPDPHTRHISTLHRWEYTNGSVLAYGGMADDEQREQIRSIGTAGGLDIVWMEEATAFTEDDYNELRARMRGQAAPWRQIILTTNPDSPHHWINQRLIIGREAHTHYSTAHHNPHNPADYTQSLDSLTGILRARLRDGLWIQPEGAVYTEFTYQTHVLQLPGPWGAIHAGLDPGYTNPAAIVLLADHDADRRHVLAEYYATGRTHDQLVAAALDLQARYNIATLHIDPSAPSLIDSMRRAGLNALPAHNDIITGINAIKALLADRDGSPSLTIDPKCTNTIAEFLSYTWPTQRPNRNAPEVPQPTHNHALDALRYALTANHTTPDSAIIEYPQDPLFTHPLTI